MRYTKTMYTLILARVAEIAPPTQEQRDRISKFIDDLRSGNFEQTTGRLRRMTNTNSYCCLGVACETYLRLTGRGKWLNDGIFVLRSRAEEAVMPLEVGEFFGFTSPHVGFEVYRNLVENEREETDDVIETFRPITFNDNFGLDFDKIADIFEWWFGTSKKPNVAV